MSSKANGSIFRVAIPLIAALTLFGCSANSDSFPQIANPPPFDYIDGEELRSNMHQLAFELQQLDMALLDAYVDRARLETAFRISSASVAIFRIPI